MGISPPWRSVIIIASFFILTFSVQAASSIVISEIQTGGQDSADEFIELWNGTNTPVVLETWSLQYKTATGKTITKKNFNKGATIPAFGFYLIARKEYKGAMPADMTHSTISLAEKGGNLFLVSNQEVIVDTSDPDIVDRVAWGTGDAGEGKAVPAPEAGQSIERKPGGENGHTSDTNTNAQDFILQTTPTPKNTSSAPIVLNNGRIDSAPTESDAAPQPSSSPPLPSSDSSPSAPSQIEGLKKDQTETKEETKKEQQTPKRPSLVFSEIFPNPYGDDASEFIELKNESEKPVDLFEWRVEDDAGQVLTLSPAKGVMMLEANGFLLLPRSQTQFTLRNGAVTLKLFSPDRKAPVETLAYRSAPDGQAYVRTPDGVFAWTTMPTPGTDNTVVSPNRPPTPTMFAPKRAKVHEIIPFDASDSFDLDRDPLLFFWNFGDGKGKSTGPTTSYLYERAGEYTVRVDVYDGKVQSSSSITIVIDEPTLLSAIPPAQPAGGNAPLPLSEIKTQAKIVLPATKVSSTTIQSLDMSALGKIVSVGGEIVESKGTYFLVDTGSNEVKVAFTAKNKLVKPHVQLGEIVRVTGIVDRTTTGLRLLPRSLDDVERQTPPKQQEGQDKTAITTLPPRSPWNPLVPYTAMTVGTGVVGMCIVGIKKYLAMRKK